MSEITFQEFIETALSDATFRQQLRHNPAQALESIGIDNPDLVYALENFDWDSIDTITSYFERGQGASGAFVETS